MRRPGLALCFSLALASWAGPFAATAAAAPGPAKGKARPASAPAAASRLLMKPSFDGRTGLAEPGLGALVAAMNRNDRLEFVRLAERVGVARLLTILRSPDKSSDKVGLLATLEAVRVVDGGVRLLAPTARLVLDNDARVSERAARTVGDLLRADRLDKLVDWEITADEVMMACSALSRVAEGHIGGLQARVAALEALSEAHAFCKVTFSLAGLGSDVWPEVRRAALLAPQMTRAESYDAVGELTEDAVPLVAGAAAVVWCRTAYERLKKGANGEVEKRRLFRLRMMLLADIAPPEDTAEILPCLALSKDPEDQKAVELIRKRQAQATAAPTTPASTSGLSRW